MVADGRKAIHGKAQKTLMYGWISAVCMKLKRKYFKENSRAVLMR